MVFLPHQIDFGQLHVVAKMPKDEYNKVLKKFLIPLSFISMDLLLGRIVEVIKRRIIGIAGFFACHL